MAHEQRVVGNLAQVDEEVFDRHGGGGGGGRGAPLLGALPPLPLCRLDRRDIGWKGAL